LEPQVNRTDSGLEKLIESSSSSATASSSIPTPQSTGTNEVLVTNQASPNAFKEAISKVEDPVEASQDLLEGEPKGQNDPKSTSKTTQPTTEKAITSKVPESKTFKLTLPQALPRLTLNLVISILITHSLGCS
jgi:hypothetical protein